MLNIFSFIYFIWVFAAIGLMVLLYFVFRHKSDTFKYRLLFGFIIFGWVLHFSRYWLDPDLVMHTLFFEDLCGFNLMLYPFLFLSKSKLSKDIMYFVGALFASHSLFYPNNIEGDPILYFNTIRFFFAHFILVSVPVLLVAWKMHKPQAKNIPYLIVYVLIGALYNFALSAIYYATGFVNGYINFMGLWANTDSVYRLFEKVAPFFRYETLEGGVMVSKAIPFIYMIPGLILFYTPVWLLMSFPSWKVWTKIKTA